MCGIVGVMMRDGAPADPARVRAMADALAHRGPDGEGFFHDGEAGLGHRRLSIIDLEGGAQPIGSEAGAVIIANGEIYNYRELVDELGRPPLRTHSDSELALHAYLKDGLDFADRLRGMYGLAIFDPRERALVLARDPFGIKPLYYAETRKGLVFASEIPPLFASGLLAPELDAGAAVEAMSLAFTTGARTCFAGVKRLLPGETILARAGEIARRRQARIVPQARPAPRQDEAAALKALDETLADTVDMHTRADVRYGVFLSGGVDSCSIVASMKRRGLSGFPCFTARFHDASVHDESDVARAVARSVDAEHVTIAVSEADFWATLGEVARNVDDLTLDPAMIPLRMLAKAASEHVKVVLCGDGGDEIFGGYRRYERALVPAPFRRPKVRRKSRFAGADAFAVSDAHWREGYAAVERDWIGRPLSAVQQMQAIDGAEYLPNHHLAKLDRCLMAAGVEGRTPFLDARVGAFGYGLADKLKVRPGQGKYLLRRWLDEALPEAGAFAPKRGFSVPVIPWLRGRRPALSRFLAAQEGVRAVFKPQAVQAALDGQAKSDGARLWAITLFGLWHEAHVARGDLGAALRSA